MEGAVDFCRLSVEKSLKELGSSRSGLSQEEALKRWQRFGPNTLTPPPPPSAWAIYLAQFKSSLILVLIGAAVLLLVVWLLRGERSDFLEASLILGIVAIISFLGFAQEYKAERALNSLKKMAAARAKVLRGGKIVELDSNVLVPGDIVILEEGQRVPADLRIIEVAELGINEAVLTGESLPIKKGVSAVPTAAGLADQTNLAFSGTVVTQGRGVGAVIRTGNQTEIGRIAKMVADIKEDATPIQRRLDKTGRVLGLSVTIIAAVVFVFVVFFAAEFREQDWLERILNSFIAAVALAVAAIPEGLPAVVTISLSLGTQRLLKRNVLVRRLGAVETLGSTDVICADKTGTITRGEMTVTRVFTDDRMLEVSGIGYETTGEFTEKGEPVKIEEPELALTFKIGQICNNAVLSEKPLGDPTEIALLISAQKAGIASQAKRLSEIPFSSARKMMSVVAIEKGIRAIYSKGAPEVILQRCSHYLTGGKKIVLTESKRRDILEVVEQMAGESLRTLALAWRPLRDKQKPDETELIFVGLQGMIDPPRPEVASLVKQCRQSGVRVMMITGDHGATAAAVARAIGLSGRTLTGEQLKGLSDDDLRQEINRVNVFARINPGDKDRIVRILKELGHTVAMTGDGINDAPALKDADIGIAMGTTGTDVAKEAADMILLDDSFISVVSAIEEGRGIFHNIRKFVNYLLSCNIGEVWVIFVGIVLLQDLVLTATMLLWINIVTDGLPALALGLDPAERDIMRRRPKEFQEDIISRRLWLEMVAFSLLVALATLGAYYLNLEEGVAEARAAAFMSIIVFELVRLFIVRSGYKVGLLANWWLIAAVTVSLLLQGLLIYVPALAGLFNVSGIDWFDWLYITIASVLIWAVLSAYKALQERPKIMPN